MTEKKLEITLYEALYWTGCFLSFGMSIGRFVSGPHESFMGTVGELGVAIGAGLLSWFAVGMQLANMFHALSEALAL